MNGAVEIEVKGDRFRYDAITFTANGEVLGLRAAVGEETVFTLPQALEPLALSAAELLEIRYVSEPDSPDSDLLQTVLADGWIHAGSYPDGERLYVETEHLLFLNDGQGWESQDGYRPGQVIVAPPAFFVLRAAIYAEPTPPAPLGPALRPSPLAERHVAPAPATLEP